MFIQRLSSASFVSLLACAACSDPTPEAGAATSSELRTSSPRARTVTVESESCPYYGDEGSVRALQPGTKVEVVSPAGYEPEELFGLAPDLVPGWSLSKRGGQSRLGITVGPAPVELFAGVSRIVMTGPDGSSHICYFDVQAKNVLRASAYEWLAGTVDAPVTVDRDLGEVKRGGTVLVDGAPFGDAQTYTKLVEADGDAEPLRVTETGYGNGTYVFEANDLGDAQFDLKVVISGYSHHVSRVHWRVVK